MSNDANPGTPAIDVRNLREFFRDSVHDALVRQQVGVDDHTEHYVVNLLTMFARSEALFEPTPDGPRLNPLALMLAGLTSGFASESREPQPAPLLAQNSPVRCTNKTNCSATACQEVRTCCGVNDSSRISLPMWVMASWVEMRCRLAGWFVW